MQYITTRLIAAGLVAGMATPALAERDGRGKAKRLDTDGDGLISESEFRFPGERMLRHADTDGDGTVTSEEMAQAQAEQAERMSEHQAQAQAEANERFAAMDADGDGAVTTEEARAHAFAQVDEDGDGYISREERRAMGHRGNRGRGFGDRDGRREHGRRHDQ